MTPANASTALATVVVDELVRCGVRDLVLAPGSRSAPLAYELFEADKIGLLRLHVRIDERTAGFLALGLAKASERPVAVVTTSGTAAPAIAALKASDAGRCSAALLRLSSPNQRAYSWESAWQPIHMSSVV